MPDSAAPAAPAAGFRRTRRAISTALNRFVASDPGLTRLRTAAQTAVSVGVVILLEGLFVAAVHPLFVPDGGPGAAAQNHAITVMAMMAGAMVVMVSSFAAPMFATVRGAVGGLLLLPTAMLVGIVLALLVGDLHVLALALMVAVLGGAGFLRRFASVGFVLGQGLFMGYFLGFFLVRITDLGGIGWVALELAIGAVVAVAAHLLVFTPGRWTAVRRLRASFLGRADAVAAATIDLIDDPGSRAKRRRQHTLLIRLNETALMIDAQLAENPSLPVGESASRLHRLIFMAELSLANAARFVRGAVVMDGVPAEGLALARQAMVAIRARDMARVTQLGAALRSSLRGPDAADGAASDVVVVLNRLATSIVDYGEAMDAVLQQRFASPLRRRREPDTRTAGFEASVSLASGWLPGSSGVSATASREKTAQPFAARLEPSVRSGIQMTVAALVAVVAGALLSPDRFYWAVLAAFVTFMGAHNAAEQVRKGAFRVIGTVIGVLLGAWIAHLVGDRPALSIAVILGMLFLGIYLMRVSYAFFAIAITVLVAQLYVQLNELTNDLLALRLLETLIGAAVAVLTVLFVLPLRTGRVVRVATREFIEALAELVRPTILLLRDSGYEQELRTATRNVDAAFQALEAATAPGRALLRIPGTMGGVDRQWWFAANAAHSAARNLVVDMRRCDPVSGEVGDALGEAGQQLMASANALARGLGEHATSQVYTRSASRFERIAVGLDDHGRVTPRQLALRDLQLIDGALAGLAEVAGLPVRAVDTPS